MTVKASIPYACTFRTEGPKDYSIDEIQSARRNWARFEGFSGETCGKCNATANVLAASAGWHCACGHFNIKSWTNKHTLHDLPDYGPRRLVVVAAMADDEPDDSGTDGQACGCK